MTTRRMSRARWGLALSAGLVAMLGLLACADGTRAGHPAADQVAAQLAAQLTPSATAASAGEVTPTPTFRPTEQAPTPQDIDREFEDTDDTEQDRRFLVQRYVEPMVRDTDVLMAMVAVPRHAFVPTRYLGQAYADHPLPIGYGQTISQPSLVAMMTEMLELEPGDRVLEIGTGSGYQAAILRELTDEVYTIEIIPELAGTARRVFDQLGYGDIHTLRGDGYYGWWEYAPFDAIIVTAAPDHIPGPLIMQLNPEGGRMVIPVGPPGGYQSLFLITRDGDQIEMQEMFGVAFVPFTRGD